MADRSAVYPRIITPQLYVHVQRDGGKFFAKLGALNYCAVGATEKDALTRLTTMVEEVYSTPPVKP